MGPPGETSVGKVAAAPGRSLAMLASLALAVFERHPYGIVIATRDGEPIAHNAAARALLGCDGDDLEPRAAEILRDMLGSGRADGPLGGVSLPERAIVHGTGLPEVRFDLPGDCGAEAAWVTAAPLGEDESVIVELRPGRANDRRRRTDPHWTQGPALRVFTLGRTRVESLEGPIGGRWLATRAGQVLKFLVTERARSVSADEIAERLWTDASLRSLQGVRYFMHSLRDRLEPERTSRAPSSFVRWTGGGYGLERSRVYVDADEFEEAIVTGMARVHEDEDRARRHLERGLALYGGDFLADEPYAEWAIPERDRLRGLAGEALRALAAIKRGAGDLAGAGADLERLVELEPYDVDVHRELLAVALRRGRRTEALRRYDWLRHRMLDTFGEDLDFTLADLAADTDPARP